MILNNIHEYLTYEQNQILIGSLLGDGGIYDPKIKYKENIW